MAKRFIFLSLAIAASLALASCAANSPETGVSAGTSTEDSSGTSAEDQVRQIEVRLTEFAFDPAHIEVSPGETVKFILINDGAIEHEFELTNAVAVDEHLEGGHDDHGDDEAANHDDEGAVQSAEIEVDVEPGETVELEVTFPDDTSTLTEFVCLIPAHYEAGMHGQIQYAGAL